MSTQNITEKERRWLLKRTPVMKFDEEIFIHQFYIDGYRYRSSKSYDIHDEEIRIFERIKKVSIGIGHNEEIEVTEITKEEFYQKFPEREREIHKKRNVLNAIGYKFEVDVFSGLDLVIMEIEGVEMSDIILFPPEIEKQIIMEITGLKQFNNFNLAS